MGVEYAGSVAGLTISRPARPTASLPGTPNMDTIIAHYVTPTSAVCGDIRVSHRTPALALARKLIKAGHDPRTILQMVCQGSGTPSLRGPLGKLASLSVDENDRRGPLFVPYRDDTARLVALRAASARPAAVKAA